MPWAFIQAMSFFTSAITSGPMPSPASRRSLWVAIVFLTQNRAIAKGRREACPCPPPSRRRGASAHGCGSRVADRGLKPAVPVVALVLPVAARVVVLHVHRDDVLWVLEAELGRHAALHREAVLARQD